MSRIDAFEIKAGNRFSYCGSEYLAIENAAGEFRPRVRVWQDGIRTEVMMGNNDTVELLEDRPYGGHPSSLHIYPAGTRVSDVQEFDRSMKIVFCCPEHRMAVYASKDPYVSTWFPYSASTQPCPPECLTRAGEQIVVMDYLPTSND